MNILNYNTHWDPACPVLLPVGEVTIKPIISASMGLFVPFFVFACLIFNFLSGQWLENCGIRAQRSAPPTTADMRYKKNPVVYEPPQPDGLGGGGGGNSVLWFTTNHAGAAPRVQMFPSGLVSIFGGQQQQ
jgi:hypothetical protein